MTDLTMRLQYDMNKELKANYDVADQFQNAEWHFDGLAQERRNSIAYVL